MRNRTRAGAGEAPPASSGPRAPGRGPGCGHGPAEPTCLVGAVFARVPAGPRRPPAQPGGHHGRLVPARPAAGGAAPGPAAAAAAARAPARPRRPRRQEAAEPVPFHGGRPCAAPRSAPLGSTRLRSGPLGSAARRRGSCSGPELSAAQPDCARSSRPTRRSSPLGSREAGRAGRAGAGPREEGGVSVGAGGRAGRRTCHSRGVRVAGELARSRQRCAEVIGELRPQLRPFRPGRRAGGAGGAAGSAPRRSRVFRRSVARAAPPPSHPSFRASGRSPRPWAASTASPPGAMAAAAGDGAVKPLQCAMKLANGAIELDTGNRPRVRRGAARRGAAGPVPTRGRLSGRGRGRGRGVGAGRDPRRLRGAGRGVGSDLGQLPGLSAAFSRQSHESEPEPRRRL